ncbi:MFS transporter [Lacipirellula parvula]|uniref:Putative MFS-type transporter n=1 Tax=Lacipirellula parvula TaxID=2650471 RepID=A0A5K7XBN5_9BACT|nr:MFS transporter [Lacipirellula parvula]BBO33362.1 putative MFS-type transporter [Lacipirellula parvula]
MTISPAQSNDQLDENSVPVSRQSRFALDALTFFLADVQDGLGPYLAIYLTSVRRWTPSDVGIAMASVVIGTLLAQLPAGAFIDVTRRKRFAVSVAAGVVATCCIVMISCPQLPVIVIAQTLIGAAAAILPPAVAGISLGLVGRRRFARRTGRNEAFNHAGNVAAAILAGALGTYLGYATIFYLVAGMAVASGISAMLIRESEIDHERARESVSLPSATRESLIWNGRLLRFLVAIFLFHFANAAMLPLVGQKVSIGRDDSAAALMSACIIAAQIVMVPVALAAAWGANRWSPKAVFVIAFAVLPIRGLLYTYSANSTFLVTVQLLDGIGAGIYGVVGVLMVADLAKGTGRFNTALAAMALVAGLGSASSNVTAGLIADSLGYNAAFISLSIVAGLGLVWFYFAVRNPSDLLGGSHLASQCRDRTQSLV